MLNIDFTFVWTAVNLIILYLFLKKFLFGKVGKYMDDRAKSIEDDMKLGRDLKAEGEAMLEEQRSQMDAAVEKRREIIDDAREKATKEHDGIISEARKEATRITAAAHEEAEREREKMLVQLRDDVATLALAAASKVVEANMDNEKNRKLVGELLDKEGVA